MKNYSSQRGTTLLETIIYVGLLTFIMSASLVSVYQILSTSSSNTSKVVVEQEANFIISKISWALNNAVINTPGPNSSGSSLSVTSGGNTIIFALSGNDITIKESGSPMALNTSRIKITGLGFQHVQQVGPTTANSLKIFFYVDGKYFEAYKNIR